MGLNIGIVGAGPAGTAAAIALTRAGHRVTIFEKARPPRDKACGDALIPDAVRCLERLDVFERIAPQLFRVPLLRIVSPAGLAVDAEGPIYTCRRARFDTLLLDAACASARRWWWTRPLASPRTRSPRRCAAATAAWRGSIS